MEVLVSGCLGDLVRLEIVVRLFTFVRELKGSVEH